MMKETLTTENSNQDQLLLLHDAITSGVATLLLGQAHTEELIRSICREYGSLNNTAGSVKTMPDLFASTKGDPAALATIKALFETQSPSMGLLELASLPWSCVLTSAVDPVVFEAFFKASPGRQIIQLHGRQTANIARAHSRQHLNLVRMFGWIDPDSEYAPPVSNEQLVQASLIEFPQTLGILPRLVGFDGTLVIEGMIDGDWIAGPALETLNALVSVLPEGKVHWFSKSASSLPASLQGRVFCYDDTFQDVLRNWKSSPSLVKELDKARAEILGTDSHVVTITRPDGKGTQKIEFSPSEWREIARVASIIDDRTIVESQKRYKTKEERLPALRKFLSTSHAGVPDWAAIGAGFIFERKAVAELIADALQDLKGNRPREPRSGQQRGQLIAKRLPVILSGAPAAGKTVGLLLAAWKLQVKHGFFAMYLLRSTGRLNIVAIEKLCRLVEGKGVQNVAILADDLDLEEYLQLNETLVSKGRNAVIIGTESSLVDRRSRTESTDQSSAREEDSSKGLGEKSVGYRHSISRSLVGFDYDEREDFNEFIKQHGIIIGKADSEDSKDFLRALAGVFPEIKFGALKSILDEYARLVSMANEIQQSEQEQQELRGPFHKLLEVYPELGQVTESDSAKNRFDIEPLLQKVLQTVLFCSQVDKPIPVDVLIATCGNAVLSRYKTFASLFLKTALLSEITLDYDATFALTAEHQMIAEWLLRSLLPEREDQLKILRDLCRQVRWDGDAAPGQNEFQDFVMDLTQRVVPRGRYSHLFQSEPCLEKLVALLEEIRMIGGMQHPTLLRWQATILGDLLHRHSGGLDVDRERAEKALDLLETAYTVLSERKASDARNHSISMILTLMSDIRGSLINCLADAIEHIPRSAKEYETSIQEILDELGKIEWDTAKARSFAPRYHPLDVNYWSHRDVLKRLPKEFEETAIKLLATMEDSLERAKEEPLEGAQLKLYEGRCTELALYKGQTEIGTKLAADMRAKGDFSGEVLLSKHQMAAQKATSKESLVAELRRLDEFGPSIYSDLYAMRYMHRLWTDAFIGVPLGSGKPIQVAADNDMWKLLRRIVEARLAHEEDAADPYVLFFQGWSLYQLNDPRSAAEAFERLILQSGLYQRRIGQLCFITDEAGQPRIYKGRVESVMQGRTKVRFADLARTLVLRPEVETEIAPSGLTFGQYLEFKMALNYQGPLPVGV